MAIQYNENIKIAAPAPLDKRYLSNRTSLGVQLPYSGVTEVTGATGIILSERYTGLTVNINGIEYWFKNGVTNNDLIEKKYDTLIPNNDFVTGATNIGYFSGLTGIQTLPITYISDADYDGLYYSLYNYYYRGTDGNIHIGIPSDGIPKRGYVKTTIPVKSWLWNEYTGSSNELGWILISGNIANQLGTFQGGVSYYPPSTAYTETSWTTGIGYNNGSNLVISTVAGSLTTGSTLTVGGRPFAEKNNKILEFRTIISDTPNVLAVRDDETFIYLSGGTGNQILFAANGLTKVGQTVKLGGTLTGTTTITDARTGSTAVGIQYGADYSANFTDRSLIDKGYLNSISALGGERIYKTICQTSHGFSVGQVVGWSGCTYNKPLANGLYDGEVLGVVTNCYNADCFELTQAGFVSGITVGGGLVINTTYFLSATVAGCLTACEPTTPNYLSKSMLIATSNGSCGCGWVLPYAGYIITSGITQGGALIRSVCNISTSPYAVTCSDFYIGAQGGDIVQLVSNVNGQVVVVDDVCGNAAIGCEIQISGVFFGGSSTSYINTAYGSMTFIYNGGKAKWSAIGFSTAPY
jgi:hypothetical protein